VRTRPALLPVLALLTVTACSSGGGTPTQQSLQTSPTATPSSSATGAAVGRAGTGSVPTSGATATTGGTVTAPTHTAVRPLTTKAPGKPAVAKATAPGVYTYDSTGTVTLGSPGTPQAANGTATLTVSAITGDVQHSTLHSDSTGDTEEDLLVRDTGTYAASLKLTSAAFNKEFRPSPAVLLVPDPARVGAAWSWSGVSTDSKTTVRTTNKILRSETITVGGQQVPCVVLQSHLVLTGDIDYTADVTTWWAPSYRLPVKDRTVGKGSYNGFPFATDITGVLRSVRPS
jgi:hypothetical protein